MKVYIVLQNDEIETVFLTLEQAQHHVATVKGWNVWQIVEKEVKGSLV